ncbi:O-antigen ligase family protein [Brasilonema octagenarum UFV-E1]|uniref:O-antigen ligase family protein n=1 Tax=Brasilonema sennae CENA114 TaxID=415709 RepID=A0A856MIQ9_9CYAN|nr:O-antigen ligase [Brasilonema sennae]QDL08866.1 O-antigen ligase family protein [Brasilonema sennae CENA114]QDL15223.1 O-antigen ligase family protein [Brasilonema octagenarum UFV-E1]
MHRFSRLAEKVFVVLTLFFSTTALIPILIEKEDSVDASQDPYTPILFMGIYIVTLLLVMKNWKSFLYVAQRDIWIWLLVGIALASVLWTVAPDITPRRSVLFLGTTGFGVYLATRYTMREQLELLAWMFGLIILLSFVFAIALPSYGLMTFQEKGIHAGAWRGVITHKNTLGRLMNVSTIVFLLLCLDNSLSQQKYKWLSWLGFVLSVVLIILSTSKTALIVLLTLTIILPLYKALRGNYNQIVPLVITVVLVVGTTATLLLDNLPLIATALGKDLTLTGRTDIWGVMLELIWERPLLGYGFNAVWQSWDNEVTAYLWRTLEWESPYGHNGFMDLLAELGILGLIVFAISYITACIKGVMWLRLTKMVEGLFPLMYLTFLFMSNITESNLVVTNNIFWILYVSIIFSMAVESEQAKLYKYESSYINNEEWIEIEASSKQDF